MVEFAYKATDLAGKIFEGSMEGRDEKMVVESLQKTRIPADPHYRHSGKNGDLQAPHFRLP